MPGVPVPIGTQAPVGVWAIGTNGAVLFAPDQPPSALSLNGRAAQDWKTFSYRRRAVPQ